MNVRELIEHLSQIEDGNLEVMLRNPDHPHIFHHISDHAVELERCLPNIDFEGTTVVVIG